MVFPVHKPTSFCRPPVKQPNLKSCPSEQHLRCSFNSCFVFCCCDETQTKSKLEQAKVYSILKDIHNLSLQNVKARVQGRNLEVGTEDHGETQLTLLLSCTVIMLTCFFILIFEMCFNNDIFTHYNMFLRK